MGIRLGSCGLLVCTVGLVLAMEHTGGIARLEAQTVSDSVGDPLGFRDANGDGINDLFSDANGDGINDITGMAYPHRFLFGDRNGDGINDVFVDRDGDGVNDMGVAFSDTDKDGVNDNVVDFNRDRVNDITGHRYRNRSLGGGMYGRIDEEKEEIRLRGFVDRDGDGIDDREIKKEAGRNSDEMHDYFVDRDGDGICDGREIGARRRSGGSSQKARTGRSHPEQRERHMGRGGKGKTKK